MKPILNRVTITGADNSTSKDEMLEITREFPFVEWGILVSKAAIEDGRPRYPSAEWIGKLVSGYEHLAHPPKLSGHICGRWVRDICKGDWSDFLTRLSGLACYFYRYQLNFHAYLHKIKDKQKFMDGFDQLPLNSKEYPKQFIFQLDDVNNQILDIAQEGGLDAVPLFDKSGGCGVLPEQWPTREGYCGYAGGLSPENLQEQLELIAELANPPIWIDVETLVRTSDDQELDMERVVKFLKVAKPWMITDG